MARRGPSLTALLGLLAFAGYQNRDKISEMLSDARQNVADNPPQGQDHQGQSSDGISSFLSDISSRFSGSAAGATLSSALNELMGSFSGADQKETAESWVSHDNNRKLETYELERAIGQETLDHLSQQTGLSREELVERLTSSIPDTVNRFTPEGRVPSDDEGFKHI